MSVDHKPHAKHDDADAKHDDAKHEDQAPASAAGATHSAGAAGTAATPAKPPEPEKLPQWRFDLEPDTLAVQIVPDPNHAGAKLTIKPVVDKDKSDLPTDAAGLAALSLAISLTKIADAYQRSLGLK